MFLPQKFLVLSRMYRDTGKTELLYTISPALKHSSWQRGPCLEILLGWIKISCHLLLERSNCTRTRQ
nr:hypothetical protein Iba_scaffold493CG0010 [Ipomoea batatas]